MKRVYYPYETFRDDLKALIDIIEAPFDAVIAIARGGMSIALHLGEYYDIREVYTVNAKAYDDTSKRERVEVSQVPDLGAAKRVLVVDDIVDSGDTMREVMHALEKDYPNVRFFSASIFYKDDASFRPTWWVKKPTGWIDFFWSVDLKREERVSLC